MQIKEYDKIRLNTDEIGTILEIFDPKSFLAEIIRKAGGIDITEISLSDIKSVFVETEHPVNGNEQPYTPARQTA